MYPRPAVVGVGRRGGSRRWQAPGAAARDQSVRRMNTGGLATEERSMRIAMFSWEALHGWAVGGVAAHVTELAAALERRGHEVHVFTRPGYGTGGVYKIDGVWYHYCPHNLKRNLVDEVQEMCRSFVWHFIQTEDYIGGFDVVHAHDWLASNAM